MSYFGLFEELKKLNLPGCPELDLYQGYFAEFYDLTTQNQTYDLEVFLKQAELTGGPILELACGTGRALIRMAKAGYDMTGLDLSSDMLELLERKLKRQPPKLKDRITLQQGDMTDFSLGKTFRLVTLPVTSICLLPDDEAVKKLFDVVYDHLEAGGRFVFDYRWFDEEAVVPEVQVGETLAFTHERVGKKQFVLYAEQRDCGKMQDTVNFYAEVVQQDTTLRFLGSTVKRIITDASIQQVIDSSKFRLVETFTVPCQTDTVKFVILEK